MLCYRYCCPSNVPAIKVEKLSNIFAYIFDISSGNKLVKPAFHNYDFSYFANSITEKSAPTEDN